LASSKAKLEYAEKVGELFICRKYKRNKEKKKYYNLTAQKIKGE
jgi:hypothetical protein